MLGRAIVTTVAFVLTTCWLLSVLPALMPYLVVLFLMALVGRLVWSYTQRW